MIKIHILGLGKCLSVSYHFHHVCSIDVAIVAVLGVLVFQLKRRPPDYIPKKMKKHVEGKPLKGKDRVDGSGYGSALPPEKLPYLVELSPGEKVGPIGKCILLAYMFLLFNVLFLSVHLLKKCNIHKMASLRPQNTLIHA